MRAVLERGGTDAGAASFRAALLDVAPLDRDEWVDVAFGLGPLPDDGPDLPRGCVPYLQCRVDSLLRAIELASIDASDTPGRHRLGRRPRGGADPAAHRRHHRRRRSSAGAGRRRPRPGGAAAARSGLVRRGRGSTAAGAGARRDGLSPQLPVQRRPAGPPARRSRAGGARAADPALLRRPAAAAVPVARAGRRGGRCRDPPQRRAHRAGQPDRPASRDRH